MVFRIICLAIAAVLGGCASPPQQKPELTEAAYHELAGQFAGINKCVAAGQMAPTVGASGQRIIHNTLSAYTYQTFRMKAYVDSLSGWVPTSEWCNTASMVVASKEQHLADQRADAEYRNQQLRDLGNAFQPKKPTFTNCNTLGTQTLCTSN